MLIPKRVVPTEMLPLTQASLSIVGVGENHRLPSQREIAGFCGAPKRAAQPQKGQYNWHLDQSPMSPYP